MTINSRQVAAFMSADMAANGPMNGIHGYIIHHLLQTVRVSSWNIQTVCSMVTIDKKCGQYVKEHETDASDQSY